MSSKVVELNSVRKKELSKDRSYGGQAVSDKGNKVYGTAAFLVLSKRAGGIDAYISQCVEHAISFMNERYGTE